VRGRLFALTAGALAILAGALIVGGLSPLQTLLTLGQGSLGSPGAISGTLRETTPLLITGIAVYIALKAGLFNIGVEGQLLVGAAAAAGVGLAVHGPLGIVLACGAGMIGGTLWAWPAGWIRAYRNGHEVITTIMLNNIAVYFTGWLLASPLRDPSQESPTTPTLDAATRLPNLISTAPLFVNSSLLIGVIGAGFLAYWLTHRVPGYELRATGLSHRAAELAGIDTKRTILGAMLISGAVAGLAGAVQVLAFEGRFYSGFSPGYGFDALGVGLLAGSTAYGLIPASLLFGILARGGTALQIEGVPKGVTTVVLGFLILIAAAIRYRQVRVVE
jgi:simple sugar transport system permease protein